jgi:serine/threonine protein kinase
MDSVDAVAIADRAVRLGLIRPEQADDAWLELGKRGGEAQAFLRAMEKRGHLTPFQSQKLLKNDTEGYFLGGYRLLYKIASGSFGRVYRADDPSTGRVFAIKVLRQRWSEKKHTIDLFEREGRMGITLQHPNIVEILAVNQDRATKQYYMVMEFVEGGNLRDFLRSRKKLEPAEALKVIEEIADGLAFAFSKGITHRDMKTTNVLISTAKVAKLVDFGLADVVDRNAPRGGGPTDDDVEVDRTVDYAGLERATGAPHGDTRSDIFFLGCVAYQLLTGRSPIVWSKDVSQRMQKERFLNIPPMTAEEVKGPPSVFRLVEMMMKLNPDERYQTPTQLLEAIRDVRREVEGGGAGGANGKKAGPHTIFLVEKEERLQDLLREKLKEKGYKVLIAGDPQRALDRFRQNPFDVFVVDAATTGDDGLLAFETVMRDAQRQHRNVVGILLVSTEQSKQTASLASFPNVAILVQPVKFKELLGKIRQLLSEPTTNPTH